MAPLLCCIAVAYIVEAYIVGTAPFLCYDHRAVLPFLVHIGGKRHVPAVIAFNYIMPQLYRP